MRAQLLSDACRRTNSFLPLSRNIRQDKKGVLTFQHFAICQWATRGPAGTFFVRVRTILFCQPHIIPFADGREIFCIFANFMLSSFCRWTKRPLGADARCPVWDILGYFATILFCQPHDILFQAHDIFSLQMDQKTSGSGCKMPSLGSMQAAFLANIASLFNSHGRLVGFHYFLVPVILLSWPLLCFFRPFFLLLL